MSHTRRSLLVLSGGHPYEEGAFEELLQALARDLGGWTLTHLLHPEAEREIADGAADDADALLFYDMAGYEFADGKVEARAPSAPFRDAIVRRFAAGKGAVAMHHALAGWAEWPEWAEMLGGRFLYQPDEVLGRNCLDSGYRHNVAYHAEVVAEHPVTAALPQTFPLVDELYLAEVFEDDVEPLIRARHDFRSRNFYSAAAAVAGAMFTNEGWEHPDGSNLVGWTRKVGDAPLVYLQFGDGPATYRDPNVRRALANALAFTAGAPP